MVLEPLKEGDVVDIIAPASACSRDVYDNCIKFIKKIGLTPNYKEYEKLVNEEEMYSSNSVEFRFKHLSEALTSDKSKAIWCLKGGYGSPRLFEKLTKMDKPKKAKLFIGYSDITALLNFFADKWGWKCLHGPMLKDLVIGNVSDESINNIKDVIFGNNSDINITGLQRLNESAKNASKDVKGKILGGCLSILQVLIGTPEQPQFKNSILILEDIGETGSRIERAFNHLARAGVFNEVKAVILGNFLNENDRGKPETKAIEQAFNYLGSYLDSIKKPLLFCDQLGHSYDMKAIPIGSEGIISFSDELVLKTKIYKK